MSPVTILALLLLVAAVVVGFSRQTAAPRPLNIRVKDLLPTASVMAGWQSEEQSIASTPEIQKVVGELLNYDEATCVSYKRGAHRITIYVAYWQAGRMSSRLVAGHTPDICWVGNGWRRVYGETRDRGVPTFPFGAEHRIFETGEQREHVIYWHVVSGRAQTYGLHGAPPWYAFISDLVTRGIDQKGEQFFVRISSNQPLAEFIDTPVVTAFLTELSKLVPTRN